MKIGNVNINGKVALAPMAGVADRAFRELCVRFGAAYVVSEMVSSKGISYASEKTISLLTLSECEKPCAIQIFGNDPPVMAQAARFAVSQNPDIIDINMGCPAPKVNKSGGGAVLMREPKLCGEIVRAIKDAVDIPVTVKIRKGWDDNNINAVLIAKICEDNGADAITIHGRTREQMYRGTADLNIIKEVKNSISIPVIGNGDIKSPEDAKNMICKTGCDMVMVGRAALGNPFIFNEINEYLSYKKKLSAPTIEEKVDIMKQHVNSICKNKGERFGITQARRHIIMYVKGLSNAAKLRDEACKLESLEDFSKFCDNILNSI